MLQSFGCDSGYYLRSTKSMIRSDVHPLDLQRLFDAEQVTKPRTSKVTVETHRF
ncbi:hypothetical protein Gotur_012100 [Gossypium turneri]